MDAPTAISDSESSTERCSSCGQWLPHAEGRKRRRFILGLVLAWMPFLGLLAGLVNAFGEISSQKATGLGAVAGGLSEMAVSIGLLAAIALPVAAIVLLVRSFSRGHALRGLVSGASIACSAFILLLTLVAGWWLLIGVRPD